QGASITMLGRHEGYFTDEKGNFKIAVPAGRAFALIFSYAGYKPVQKNFFLNDYEEEYLEVILLRGEESLDSVVVVNTNARRQPGLVVINPKYAINNPSPA